VAETVVGVRTDSCEWPAADLRFEGTPLTVFRLRERDLVPFAAGEEERSTTELERDEIVELLNEHLSDHRGMNQCRGADELVQAMRQTKLLVDRLDLLFGIRARIVRTFVVLHDVARLLIFLRRIASLLFAEIHVLTTGRAALVAVIIAVRLRNIRDFVRPTRTPSRTIRACHDLSPRRRFTRRQTLNELSQITTSTNSMRVSEKGPDKHS
jgi:hypothetical protein